MPTVTYTYDLTDIDDREAQRVHDRAQDFKCACQNFDEWLRRSIESEPKKGRREAFRHVHDLLWQIFRENDIAEILMM